MTQQNPENFKSLGQALKQKGLERHMTCQDKASCVASAQKDLSDGEEYGDLKEKPRHQYAPEMSPCTYLILPVCHVASVVSNFSRPCGLQPTRLLSMGFPRQAYWSGLPCPPPEDLPELRIKPVSHVSRIGRGVLYHQHHLGSPSLIYPHPNLSSLLEVRRRKNKMPSFP